MTSGMWPRTAVIWVAFLVSLGCSQSREEDRLLCSYVDYQSTSYCGVSIYSLIVNPQKYHGQHVVVVGYLSVAEESYLIGPSFESVNGPVVIENVLIVDGSPLGNKPDMVNHRLPIVLYGLFEFDDGERFLNPKIIRDVSFIEQH